MTAVRVCDKMQDDPLTASPDDSLLDAASRMLAAEASGMAVVEDGRLVGGLDVVDLLPELEAVPFSTVEALKLLDRWVDEHNVSTLRQTVKRHTVGEIMRSELPSVQPTDTVAEALRVMAKLDFDYVYAVDDSGRLVGWLNRWAALRVVLGED